DRYGRRRRRLNGEAGPCSSVLPVVSGGGGPGARQPVKRDVVDDVLLGQVPGRPAVDERAGDLVVAVRVVVEHPGREGDGGVQQRVAGRLRPGAPTEDVAGAARPGP